MTVCEREVGANLSKIARHNLTRRRLGRRVWKILRNKIQFIEILYNFNCRLKQLTLNAIMVNGHAETERCIMYKKEWTLYRLTICDFLVCSLLLITIIDS